MNNPAPPALFLRAAAHDMKGLNLEDQQKQNLRKFLLPVSSSCCLTQDFLTDRGNE